MGPTGTTRVVQIHPTRRCNLRCQHCYSSSSPRASQALEADLLRSALDGLAAEQYNWASFSGGEPVLYPGLPALLGHAKQVGMQTAVVSNGMLLTPRRLDAIQPAMDLLVISLDGMPGSHNRIRQSDKAFDAMATKLPDLQARGIRFGFLFTLTQHNLDELPWVAEFALNVGAKLLQIHPLEYFGHAAEQLAGKAPDAIEAAHAWRLVEKLQQLLAGQVAFQMDLVHTDVLHRQPDSFFLGACGEHLQGPLGRLLSPLVIEPDGELVPTQYGFHRSYSLGNLHQQSIHTMADDWRCAVGPRFHHLCRQFFETLPTAGQGHLFNWYEQIAAYASQQAPVAVQTLPFPRPVGLAQPAR